MLEKLKQYLCLIRLHKPIGILLLLWPTLWALWLVSEGQPDWRMVGIFVAGAFLMRSAGCIMNDIADRKWDGHVERTRERPLVTKKISVKEACVLLCVLVASSFLLVLQLNLLTIMLAFFALLLAMIYPYLKRVTHLPQLGLGITFSWGIPMVFAATLNEVPARAWLLFFAAVIWPMIYDTFYAMTDKADDEKIGVKSMAILFGAKEQFYIGLLQMAFILLMILVGAYFHLGFYYFASLFVTSFLFFYQEWLIKDKIPEKCFKAFLNNNWVGLVIFLGIVLDQLRDL
jgi:4-hydroxybenzoate polyprenyltransferase